MDPLGEWNADGPMNPSLLSCSNPRPTLQVSGFMV